MRQCAHAPMRRASPTLLPVTLIGQAANGADRDPSERHF